MNKLLKHFQNAGPWNKGKLTGAKPPLRPKHVWSIRTKLQIEGRARDLAMFNLAIDSKLRGCDVVAIRVEDVAGGGAQAAVDHGDELVEVGIEHDPALLELHAGKVEQRVAADS